MLYFFLFLSWLYVGSLWITNIYYAPNDFPIHIGTFSSTAIVSILLAIMVIAQFLVVFRKEIGDIFKKRPVSRETKIGSFFYIVLSLAGIAAILLPVGNDSATLHHDLIKIFQFMAGISLIGLGVIAYASIKLRERILRTIDLLWVCCGALAAVVALIALPVHSSETLKKTVAHSINMDIQRHRAKIDSVLKTQCASDSSTESPCNRLTLAMNTSLPEEQSALRSGQACLFLDDYRNSFADMDDAVLRDVKDVCNSGNSPQERIIREFEELDLQGPLIRIFVVAMAGLRLAKGIFELCFPKNFGAPKEPEVSAS